jgi:hypothetical protein
MAKIGVTMLEPVQLFHDFFSDLNGCLLNLMMAMETRIAAAIAIPTRAVSGVPRTVVLGVPISVHGDVGFTVDRTAG